LQLVPITGETAVNDDTLWVGGTKRVERRKRLFHAHQGRV